MKQHNLNCCVVQILDHCMDPSSSPNKCDKFKLTTIYSTTNFGVSFAFCNPRKNQEKLSHNL